MDGLRLILLILGVAVVIGVYFLAREQNRRKVRRQARAGGREPALGLDDAPAPKDDLDEERLAEELARMEAALREEGRPVAEARPAEPLVIPASRARAQSMKGAKGPKKR